MIKPRKLHYAFRSAYNRGDTQSNPKLSVAMVDSYLNEGMDIWFENEVDLYDTSGKITENLSYYVVTDKSIDISDYTEDTLWFCKYPNDYYRKLRAELSAKKESCGRRRLKVNIFQSDDINEAIRDDLLKSSYEYEEVIAHEEGSGIVLFKGDFDAFELYMTYIRKPNPIACPSLEEEGSYVNEEGEKVSEDSIDIGNRFIWRAWVDIAVLNAHRDFGDIQDYRTQLELILKKSYLK